MRKHILLILLILFYTDCFCEQSNFDWVDLPPFGYISNENWNSIVEKRSSDLCYLSTDCEGKEYSICYLTTEPEYKINVDYGNKRVVFLIKVADRVIKSLCFITCEDINKNILYKNKFICGVQGYNNKRKISLISNTILSNNISVKDISPYHISTGAYEWPAPDFETIKPFYFWDEYEKKIICVDIYMDEIKPIHNIRVTNPLFYYGGGDDSTNRALFICSTDPTTNTPIPNTTYELKSGKATKVVE